MTRARASSLLLLLVLAACSSSKTPAPTGVARSSGPASPGASAGASAAASSSPTTTASRQPTTSATAASTPGVARSAEPNVPPAAGRYLYRQYGSTKAGTFTIPVDETGSLQIDPATSGGGGMRQQQLRTYSDNEKTETVFLFRDDGVYIESTTATIYGFSQECRTAEPILGVELPLRVGATWRDTGECSGMDLTVNGSVLRTENRTVGGRTIMTYVIRVTAKGSGEQGSQTTTETMWLSPAYRLTVHSESKSSGTSQGVQFTREVVETLVSLTPR